MKLSNILLGTMVALSSTSCKDAPKDRLKTLMKDKPVAEYQRIVKSCNSHHTNYQSAIDSLVYRDVFEKTALKLDSNLVNKFDSITEKLKTTDRNSNGGYIPDGLINSGITTDEYFEITKRYGKFMPNNDMLQFKADSAGYTNFFKKHGIYTKYVQKLLKNAAKQAKP